MSETDAIVILGGGIIGLSIAYYLSESPADNRRIHIVDSAPELLQSASGFAGGFLARDWFPERAAALGDLSFQLHRQLADTHNGQGRWGYTGSHVYSLTHDDSPTGVRGEDWLLAGTSRAQSVGRRSYGHVSVPGEDVNKDGTPAWMTPQPGASWSVVASIDDCAQVEPRKLCDFLLAQCLKRGVRLHLATRAAGVVKNNAGSISGLILESTDEKSKTASLYCSDIVIAAGCWTPRVFKTLFPQSRVKIDIDALAGHSLLYRSPRYTKPFANTSHRRGEKISASDKYIAYAIYCPPAKGLSFSPEAYARLDGDGNPEIWIGGLNNNSIELPLPERAMDAKNLINKDRIAELRRTAVELTGMKGEDSNPAKDDLEVISEALCFRPVSKSGVPILSEVQHEDLGIRSHATSKTKVWLAGGHGPWGISLSLGTGMVMSEMIRGRQPRVDVSGLNLPSTVPSKL